MAFNDVENLPFSSHSRQSRSKNERSRRRGSPTDTSAFRLRQGQFDEMLPLGIPMVFSTSLRVTSSGSRTKVPLGLQMRKKDVLIPLFEVSPARGRRGSRGEPLKLPHHGRGDHAPYGVRGQGTPSRRLPRPCWIPHFLSGNATDSASVSVVYKPKISEGDSSLPCRPREPFAA